MILEGNLRGGARNLALHLQKDENDHVDVHEMRGFVADELEPAFKEMYAVSRGTRAKKFMYSLSFNPPPDQDVATGTFRDAIEKAEKELGLEGQPRAIVFHTKDARRHCHAVWSTIDAQNMKAIHISHDRLKLMDISRELYLENGWKMPKGFIRGQSPDPNNFAHGEWMQAKRSGKHPNEIKATIRDCWAASDTQASFEAALKEKGYFLAAGRRGPVVVDTRCEIRAIAKAIGVKVKDIRARVDESTLKSAEDKKIEVAKLMQDRLTQLQQQRESAIDKRLTRIVKERHALKEKQQAERARLAKLHKERNEKETLERQKRFNKGLRGILDFFTGKRKQITIQNERETAQSKTRDQKEKNTLIFTQLDQYRKLKSRMDRVEEFDKKRRHALAEDLKQCREIDHGRQAVFEHKHHISSKGPFLDR